MALINNPAHAVNALYVFLITVAFAAFLWIAVRPCLVYLIKHSDHDNGASQTNVFFAFSVMVISSFFTQAVGVDVIFGAFLVGLITPHDRGFAIAMTEKIEDLVSILFLPLYFAYAGLNVNLGDLNDGQSWLFVLLVVAVACGGKIIGCTLAARSSGIPWRESFTVGFLMNTKGLVELIVLNLGLQAGVITKKLYAIFLIMALVTTFMTVPVVNTIYPTKYHVPFGNKTIEEGGSSSTINEKDSLNILVCLPSMRIVPATLNLLSILFGSSKKIDLYALRLVELGQRLSKVMMASETGHTMNADPVLNLLKTFSQLQKQSIKTLMSITTHANFGSDIVEAGEDLGANLVIFPMDWSTTTKGWALPVIKAIWDKASFPTAVFVDRGFGSTTSNNPLDSQILQVPERLDQKILFLYSGCGDDVEATVLMYYLASNPSTVINIIASGANSKIELEPMSKFANVTIEEAQPTTMSTITRCATLGAKDLIILSHEMYESNTSTDSFRFWLDNVCKASFIIIKKGESERPLDMKKRQTSARSLTGIGKRPKSIHL